MGMNWTGLAITRTKSVLGTRYFACLRTLEAKISEAGPEHLRPEPVYLTQARKALLRAGKITAYQPTDAFQTPYPLPSTEFYHLPAFNPLSAANRELVQRIVSAYSIHHNAAHASPMLCGRVLEDLIFQAANQASNIDVFGSPGNEFTELNGRSIKTALLIWLLERKPMEFMWA